MQIAKPQVHLSKNNSTNVYTIHVITWMDNTQFEPDGNETLSSSASNGVYTVTLKLKKNTDRPNLNLLTPIIHTLVLNGVALSEDAPQLEVKIKNTTTGNVVGRRRTHKDDSDDSGMPTP